jgi:hypothetical protein
MGQQRSIVERGEPRHDTRVLLGLAIVLVGVAMLVQRNDAWGIHLHIGWWPFLLILLGLVRMLVPAEHRGRRSRRTGFWLLAVGAWGLISEMELFGLDYSTSWPLLLIALGINIVWKSVGAPPDRRIQEH